jgi:integrase
MVGPVTEGQVELAGEAPKPAVTVPEDAPTAIVLATLAEEGRRLDANARARRTWASYQRDWRHFTDWCTSVDLDPLPAAPSTVALYLTEAAKTLKVSTLRRRLAAISVVHQGYGHPSPTVDVVVRTRMKGIARDKAGEQVTRKSPAWGRDVRRMVAGLGDDPRGARDRALLTIGFAGGFRRSELVGLDVGDVTETNDGLVVRIRRSKTDQEGTGRTIGIPYGSHPSSCPVRAFRAWRQITHDPSGPLFRRIHGRATLGGRLADRSVTLIVKDAASRIGLDPADFAGHSLRAGFVTSAADGGASEAAIMEQTGHRSTKQLRDYMRDGRLFHNNAAAVTGL